MRSAQSTLQGWVAAPRRGNGEQYDEGRKREYRDRGRSTAGIRGGSAPQHLTTLGGRACSGELGERDHQDAAARWFHGDQHHSGESLGSSRPGTHGDARGTSTTKSSGERRTVARGIQRSLISRVPGGRRGGRRRVWRGVRRCGHGRREGGCCGVVTSEGDGWVLRARDGGGLGRSDGGPSRRGLGVERPGGTRRGRETPR
jgi:hypothetical protein